MVRVEMVGTGANLGVTGVQRVRRTGSHLSLSLSVVEEANESKRDGAGRWLGSDGAKLQRAAIQRGRTRALGDGAPSTRPRRGPSEGAFPR